MQSCSISLRLRAKSLFSFLLIVTTPALPPVPLFCFASGSKNLNLVAGDWKSSFRHNFQSSANFHFITKAKKSLQVADRNEISFWVLLLAVALRSLPSRCKVLPLQNLASKRDCLHVRAIQFRLALFVFELRPLLKLMLDCRFNMNALHTFHTLQLASYVVNCQLWRLATMAPNLDRGHFELPKKCAIRSNNVIIHFCKVFTRWLLCCHRIATTGRPPETCLFVFSVVSCPIFEPNAPNRSWRPPLSVGLV